MTPMRQDALEQIIDAGLVAVVRQPMTEGLVEACEAMVQGGVRVIEFTLSTPGALELLEQTAARVGEAALLGVGSIVDARSAKEAVLAGASFLDSPVFKPEVVEAGHQAKLPALAGAMTPSEVLAAWEGGADLVKLFPAGGFGAGYTRDVLQPMPHVKVMCSGGITYDSLPGWFDAGAVCVGVGGGLVRKDLIAGRRWEDITEIAKRFVRRVQASRRG